MSLLIDPAPLAAEIGGQSWPLRTDYRVSLMFEQLMLDRTVAERDKAPLALSLYYPRQPPDLDGAVRAILWFYGCGKGPDGPAGGAKGKRLYDYDQDDAYIFAAFWADYGIDLETADLHWWKFRALFDALRPDDLFCKIMQWRGADTSKMKGKEKEYYQKMKRLYALKKPLAEQEKLDAIANALMNGGNLSSIVENSG